MEQRTYYGNINPEALADYLVDYFDPKENLQAQKIGQSDSHVVQIARGDIPQDARHAVTVAITPVADGRPGLTITLGQQQWLTPRMATFGAAMGLVSVLITPWALFALLWPLSELVGSATLPGDVWDSINTYVLSQGGVFGESREMIHPHI